MKKIAIITINYNNKLGLEKTINSVTSQSSKNFEYLIIDGDSNDGSKDVINQYQSLIDYWVSEKDSGIYNAMNKGIRAAKGDYLLFLNSGDWLYDNYVIENVEKQINGSKDIYYGNAVFKLSDSDLIVKYDEPISFGFFVNGNFCHQSTFIKKSLFYDISFYNENRKVVADWEFFVLAICLKKASHEYMDVIVSNYDFTGISSQLNNKSFVMKERDDVIQEYFSMFIDDYKIINELHSKRIQQVFHVKKNVFAWKILRGVINALLLFLPKFQKK